MKYLVIGDAGSIYVKEYIEYVLLNDGNTIVLLQEGSVNEDYLNFYEKNGISLEPMFDKKARLVSKIPRIRAYIGAKMFVDRVVKKYGEFDLVHIHGINFNRGNIANYVRKYTEKLVTTVWGDELLRKDERTLNIYRKYYLISDAVTVETKFMKERFLSVYGESFASKLTVNKFAAGILEYIDQCKESFTPAEICDEFGFSPDRIHVLIGHNGREAQRHFDITESLTRLSEKTKRRIELIFTMTYGVRDNEYLRQIEEECRKINCKYVVLTEFLNESKMAKLRAVSDIMVHAQLTDSFSASMCECLYAGTIIINGQWLEYGDIPDSHNRFVEFNDISEIPDKLDEVVENYDRYKEKMKENKAVIHKIVSREKTTEEWKLVLNMD